MGYFSFKEQIDYQKKLEISAQGKEDSTLDFAKKSWDSKFLNIYKSRGLYAIKLSSNDSLNFYGDSMKNEIIIGKNNCLTEIKLSKQRIISLFSS